MTGSLAGSIVTRLLFKQFCECRMLTLVSKNADRYLSGLRRSPLSILLFPLPHCIPPGMCFTATKSQLNRLRRWLSSSLNPLCGFQDSACMLHAIALAARLTSHSQLLASTSDFVTTFFQVCPSFGRNDIPIGVLLNTQHVVG